MIVERNRKYDDLPPPIWRDPRIKLPDDFTERDQQDIHMWLEMLSRREATLDDLKEEVMSDRAKQEIKRSVPNIGMLISLASMGTP